ncbi:MAG: peptide chain release factor eRF1/aRF1 [Hyperionvirus sp.]|uniref:Peptide chain release factor eRF1/aRF1 n=1 Tax=Hyperionvirus sp. TaxID=2487770 RepID=A0A3G5A920_9VIRU|nr:MAG: peptide chain release factor eRF1/aRF1 [Hyperionvirus sp.]
MRTVNKFIATEATEASNIKKKGTRTSVLKSLAGAKQFLKRYPNAAPKNGVAVFCGETITGESIAECFEPFRPITTEMFKCDSVFHTEWLANLLTDDDYFGFVIIDGNGALFGMLQGHHKVTLRKFSVDLPTDHGRGGQSAARFGRLNEQKRERYVDNVVDAINELYIAHPVKGIIIAGFGRNKFAVASSAKLDYRIKPLITLMGKPIDIEASNETGFTQAIEKSADILTNIKFGPERKLLQKFMAEISVDSKKICYGIEQTIDLLFQCSLEEIIISSETKFEINHYRNSAGVTRSSVKELSDASWIPCGKGSLLDFLSENHVRFSTKLRIVSDKTAEGSEFLKNFGGIAGFLYFDMPEFDNQAE